MRHLLLPLFFCITLISCAVGVKKDLMTDLTVSNNGLSYEDVYLSSDGKRLQDNKFAMGQVVYIQLEGVDGFSLKENMAYPGASILVTDKEGNVVLDLKDLFEQYSETGVKSEDAALLSANINIGAPMLPEAEYKLVARFWDKNSEGDITCVLGFTVVK